MSTDVVLVYPYFNEEQDQSIFRYPPLGLGYLASTLRRHDISVQLIDSTFSTPKTVLRRIQAMKPGIVGIYSMVTMNHHAVGIARQLRDSVDLLVAGGPLPSLTPDAFLDTFDAVVMNEGEVTFLELVNSHMNGGSWKQTPGIAYNHSSESVRSNEMRPFIKNLDAIDFPARDMFPNKSYQKFWRKHHGYSATSAITTRGCPYLCDFCSNPVYGRSYRERSPQNVLEEMHQIKDLGYDRVFFTDDCFTLNPERTEQICRSILKERLDLQWMCLTRADGLSRQLAELMAKAGCVRTFFGIESGSNRILRIMNKRINLIDVKRAVSVAQAAGIETGGFFILGYPGETDDSLIETLHFSSHLPLDYLSYSFPYPIEGTGLYTKVRKKISQPEWRKQRGEGNRHQLLFNGSFSQRKLRFAKQKGSIQHSLRNHGRFGKAAAHVFERATDQVVRALR